MVCRHTLSLVKGHLGHKVLLASRMLQYISFIQSFLCHSLSLTHTHTYTTAPSQRELTFLGRTLHIPVAAGPLAMFTFKQLCSGPLSAADYLHLCAHFETIFVSNIPRMTIRRREEARRFITMVDILYDHQVKLICTAQVSPEMLFSVQTISALDEQQSRILSDDLAIEQVLCFCAHISICPQRVYKIVAVVVVVVVI